MLSSLFYQFDYPDLLSLLSLRMAKLFYFQRYINIRHGFHLVFERPNVKHPIVEYFFNVK